MDLARGSLLALVYRVLGTAFWAAAGIATARALSVSDRGTYVSAVVVASAAGSITAAFAASSGYFVANRGRLAGEVAVNGAIVSSVAGATLLAVALAIAAASPAGDRTIVALAGLAIFPGVAREALGGVFLGQGALARYSFTTYSPAIVGFLALLAWVVLLDHRSAESALAAWTAAQYFALTATALLGFRWWAWLRHHGPDRSLMRALVNFGSVTGLTGFVGFLGSRLGQLMVVGLDSREGAGIYASAVALADGPGIFAAAVATASYARVGAATRHEAAELTARTVRHALLLATSASAGLFVLAPFIIPAVYGQRYEGAVPSLQILCIGAAVYTSNGLLANYFILHLGRPSLVLGLTLLTATLNLSLGLVLIPLLGHRGAAIATTTASVTAAVAAGLLFRALSGAPLKNLWRIRGDDIAAYFRLARRLAGGIRLHRPR